jgi:stress response protein YsnF
MQTVVGVFDTVDAAQNARDALLDSGFDASEVRLQANPAAQGSDTLTTTDSTITGTSRSSTEDEGFMAGIGRFFSDLFGGDDNEHAGHYSEAVRRGSTVVAVTVSDSSRVEQARSTLAAAGAVDIDKRTESWRQEGYSQFDPTARPYEADQIASERSRYQTASMRQPDVLLTPDETRSSQVADGTVLPVVREDLEVGKREVDLGTVRVFSRTETRPVEEQVQLHEERAEIERRAVDRPATEADLKAFEGGSIEIHETAERAVVSKTARVVEEVVVGTEASTRTETISDQVRNTVVEVDKTGTSGNAMTGTGMTGNDYRSHYQSNMSSMGGTYEEYEPAYQYGSTLRSDPRYANRSWEDVEADAQRDWASRSSTSGTGGSTWEKSKQAIKHGWESMTGRR